MRLAPCKEYLRWWKTRPWATSPPSGLAVGVPACGGSVSGTDYLVTLRDLRGKWEGYKKVTMVCH
eukprot:314124-Amorphochlora_amoeboformis.AAC.2